MPQEIERKFLVKDLSVLTGVVGTKLAQGYVSRGGLLVRVRRAGDQAFLTLKGPRKTGELGCGEWEYPIPTVDADQLLEHAPAPLIVKTRYEIPVGRHTFEVDVFEGDLAGLVVAEVELASEDEAVELPAWLGREVSHDIEYTNANLSLRIRAGEALPPFE